MAIVTTQDEFRDAITNREAEVIVANDISLTVVVYIFYTVTIRGEEGVSLLWNTPSIMGNIMLHVTSAGNLTLESIIIDGNGLNVNLLQINTGSVTINEGVIVQNIYSRTNMNGIMIGSRSSSIGGNLIMNSGLVTNIDATDAVFCANGTVVMNNDAAISGNMAAGISMYSNLWITGPRSTLTMTGKSHISDNESKQSGAAGIIEGTDIIMGVNEGDAPRISDNRSPYSAGGWFMLDDATLTMYYNSEISGNTAAEHGGGLVLQESSVFTMKGNSVMRNNQCGNFGGGILLLPNAATVLLDDEAQIFENTCGSVGGGIYVRSSTVFNMQGNSAIHDNNAVSGAGIYMASPTTSYPESCVVSIGLLNSEPHIYDNKSSDVGGGIFISTDSILNLMGRTIIENNEAVQGRGIYKMGTLNLSQSLQILDGLFFDYEQSPNPLMSVSKTYSSLLTEYEMPQGVSKGIIMESCSVANKTENIRKNSLMDSLISLQQAYIDNVPIIVDRLTEDAVIQLESSGYVAPANVPLVIGDKGSGYQELVETDRAAWRIPRDFGAGYSVILNEELNQVLIVQEDFKLIYYNLFGTENLNPISYNGSDLPISLINLTNRQGYIFKGWYNVNGENITEISVGATGDLSVTAVWEFI